MIDAISVKMRIITKYYNKEGKLRVLRSKRSEDDSTVRFKIFKDRKGFPCCDFKGTCTNFAYAEVYPCAMKNNKKNGWSYLCRKHYFGEQKRLRWKLPACLKVEW